MVSIALKDQQVRNQILIKRIYKLPTPIREPYTQLSKIATLENSAYQRIHSIQKTTKIYPIIHQVILTIASKSSSRGILQAVFIRRCIQRGRTPLRGHFLEDFPFQSSSGFIVSVALQNFTAHSVGIYTRF